MGVLLGAVLAALSLAAAGCAGPATARPVTDASRRVLARGFSVLPPRGPGWFEVPSMSEAWRQVGSYGIAFVKGLRDRPPATPAEAEGVLAVVTATAVEPGPPEQMLEGAITRRRAEVGQGLFGAGTLTATPARWAGAACRRYEFALEDYGHPRFPEAVFVLAGRGVLCAHPEATALVIDAHYSQRTVRGHPRASVEAEVAPFLDSLAFTPVH